jgi:hypothetical protein
VLAHLVAYVGALALLAIVRIHLWDELPADMTLAPAVQTAGGWRLATPVITGIRRQPARYYR